MSLNLNLNLNKPLVFLKVATTGMEPLDKKGKKGDRIIEISITKINTDRTVKTGTRLVNPGIPIPQQATFINGITDSDVVNMPSFADIASNLYTFIGDSDFAGFSIANFDLKFLVEEFNRAGIPFTVYGRKIIDLSTIYHKMEPRDFRSATAKFTNYELKDAPIKSETTNNISIGILNGMVNEYSKFDEKFNNANVSVLDDNFNRNKRYMDIQKNIMLNNNNKPVFAFGKYSGMIISEIMKSDPGYCDWCINVSDLPGDTKLLIKKITDKAQTQAAQQNS